MKKKLSTDLFAIISILVISLCLPTPAQCQNQAEKLNKLFQAKMRNEIDTTPFKVVAYEKIASRIVDLPPGGGSQKDDDLIGRLPGQPAAVSFNQYGGYVNVDPVNGRNLYYYFVEAQHPNKDELPLVLWLNGGPGCSSLAYGAMTELGPFRVGTDAKTLHINKYSWNKVANVLFVESPARVGFSYSNRPSDYITGDINTAEDNFVFMQNWLRRFPEYKGRDFYMTGESYAGHYVPQLAHNILMHMLMTHDKSINLKGIMVGNAVLNDETDNKAMYDYFSSHGMASPEAVAAIHKYCDFSPNFVGNQTAECKAAYHDVEVSIAPVFPYSIYDEACLVYNGPTQKPHPFSITEYDQCSPYYVADYLNREDVQKAMHANTTNLPYRWTVCTENIKYIQASTSVLTDIQFLLANNITVWIYGGDTDARVPFISAQYSIKTMSLTVETKFHAWFIGGQVGGYTETYKEGLTFATVRGAGHEVPSYQPLRALSLFMHFIAGTPLPNSKKFEA
ncbi:Serine carboxypeptidase-like 40 [Linum grandiflorum]